MKTSFFLAAACLSASADLVAPIRAEDGDDLMRQVVTQASQNVDSATVEEVRKFAAENKGTIEQILQSYQRYLSQAADLLSDAPSQEKGESGSVSLANNQGANSRSSADGLQLGRIHSTGGLREVHLGNYPALPDVAPASSIVNPTAAQLEKKKELDDAIRARKRFLREHPAPQ